MVDLGTLDNANQQSVARAINSSGIVVGMSNASAFVYCGGQMTGLNSLISDSAWQLVDATGINDAGWIVGWGIHNGVYRAFLLTPSSRQAALKPASRRSR